VTLAPVVRTDRPPHTDATATVNASVAVQARVPPAPCLPGTFSGPALGQAQVPERFGIEAQWYEAAARAQGLVKVVPVDGEVVSVVIEAAPPSPRKERRQALDSQVSLCLHHGARQRAGGQPSLHWCVAHWRRGMRSALQLATLKFTGPCESSEAGLASGSAAYAEWACGSMRMDGLGHVAASACLDMQACALGLASRALCRRARSHTAARVRQAGEDRAVLVEDASSGEDEASGAEGERDEPAAGCAPGGPSAPWPAARAGANGCRGPAGQRGRTLLG